jgi:hypothetical protein
MTHAERAQQWRQKVEAQQASGQSARRWCMEQDVNLISFYSWRRRLSESSPAAGFVELLTEAAVPSAGVTLQWQGACLHLAKDFDEATLLRTLRLLRLEQA